jgi:D-psicose/D-tagatose/L-ribulose 3-epimerase
MTTLNPIGIISMQHQRPFTERDFPQLARWKAAGFDFVELLVPEAHELDLAATRRALDAEGLGCVLAARVNLDRNLTADDAAKRQAGRDYLRTCIDVAHALGARTVGGPLYGNPLVFAGRAPHPVDEGQRQRRVDWCVEGLREAAPHAHAAGMALGVEPLNRFETDILNTTRQGVALMKLVDHPAIGLVLDTFHMNMEDDSIADAILAARGHIAHFQANENHRGYLGTGHIDWTAVVRALAEVGYAGTISLEPFRRNDERIGIPLAQWKPPARDEQPELAASCALIKHLLHLNGTRR